jgi:hypothetical protein
MATKELDVPIEVTLSKIIELSEGKPRRMRQLAAERIFVPSDEDRPAAMRFYSISEAAIACIVSAIDQSFSVGARTLSEIAETLRHIYAAPRALNLRTYREAEELVD